MKRSSKEKLQIIQRLIDGESIKRVAKECRLGVAYLSVLYDRYKKYGKEGLCRKKNNYLSPEEKERLIRLHEEKSVSLRSIYTDYDISPSVFKNLLIKVERKVIVRYMNIRSVVDHPKILPWQDPRRKNHRQN